MNPRKFGSELDEDSSETDSDAVFQGLQAAYSRFPSNKSVFVKLSLEFRKYLENRLFFLHIAFCRICYRHGIFLMEGSFELYSMQFFALYNLHIMPGTHNLLKESNGS